MYTCLGRCQCFKGNRYMQYVTVIIASLGITSASTYLSWPSPTLSKLSSEDSPLGVPLTSEETSWVVAIFLLTGLPAALTYHVAIGNFGRKQVLQVAAIFLFLPWFLIIFGDNVIYIYVGRGIAGMVLGTTVMSTALYIGEIADVDIRGRLGTAYGVMKLVGSILVLSIGPFVSYTVLAIVCSIIPLIFFCLLFFIPESPHYLIKHDRIDEAREALIFLSGTDEAKLIDEKIHSIAFFVKTEEKPLTMRQVLSNPVYLKVLAIIITVVTMEYLGGSNAIAAYQQEIVSSSESSISPELSSIVFGLIQIPAAVISAILVDRLGRKVILYIGGIGCFIPLIAEGIYFFLEDYMKQDVSSLSWLPTTGIVMYLIMYAVHGSIPYILLGEFFPYRIKNVATTLFLTTGVAIVFLVTKTYEPIAEAWGLYTVFWIYGFFSIAVVIFTYFLLPETKGKTFQEIEDKLYK